MPDDTTKLDGGGGIVSPPPIDSGLKGSCPRCGARTLFATYIRFAERCPKCGLDFTAYNVGDGPLVFLTLGLGALITILALWVEFTFSPPFWVHILLWVPLATALTLGLLRLAKGLLLALEYQRGAREGRLQDRP